ncbi:hypothetical protein H2259_02920 [Campylobacter sp. RM10532]|uniref:hypothetical protein n=1 Tax=Campylobacter molothri TaxID=1032242 RepID=UPI00301CEE34|nr:hypothetical protein [Campylobacter sp. RM10532]
MINLYGKSGNNFYLVAKESMEGIWEFDITKYKEVNFMQNHAQYKLEDEEIFFIVIKDEEIELYLDNIKNTSNCINITNKAIKDLETIYFFQNKSDKIELFIQRITPSMRIEKNFLKMDFNKARIERNQITIPILNYTHIYWSQENKKIYFKKFSDLESVFSNFSHYYREANEKDIEKFKDVKSYPFLDIKDLDFNKTTKTKLKTLALIIDELDKIKDNLDDYKEYAKKYKPNFIKDDKFQIKDFNNIDDLSDIIFRKIYTTEAGEQEIRKTNSYKVIKNNAK